MAFVRRMWVRGTKRFMLCGAALTEVGRMIATPEAEFPIYSEGSRR